MKDETGESSVPRRQLGRLLTRLREEAAVTLEAAAEALSCSRQKIWRIEKGLVPVRVVDARALCDLYGVSGELAEMVTGLARETRAKGWWHPYGDALAAWVSLPVGLEDSASRLRYYNAELVPGLLQTREYMMELFRRKAPDTGPAEREKMVGARLHRQSLLTRRLPAAPALYVVLSEAVLRRPVREPGAMGGQLGHLLHVMRLPNVSVRLLPLAVGPPLAAEAGTFVILDFPPTLVRGAAEPVTVYIEGLTGALYLDRPAEVSAYERVWSDLDALALDEGQSTEMIRSIMADQPG